jgi:lysophospholipase L1-like esterase
MTLMNPMRRLVALAILSAALGACSLPSALESSSAAPAALPLNVGGRLIPDGSGGATFGWPGVYFEAGFRGTAVRVVFDAPTDHLRLLVDGSERMIFRAPGRVDHLVEGLSPGIHVVRLEKMTESQAGGSRFGGFFLAGRGTPFPAPARQRRIEFIGDSYTVGYGNTHAGRECTRAQVHDTTDTQQAFGPLAARRLNADYRVIAYSGFGIVRNYNGGQPGLSLPAIYSRPKPDEDRTLAEPEWLPQAVVINLGTNDFSTPLRAGERWSTAEALREDWRRTYVRFVQELQARDPQARFILMGSDMFFAEVEQVAARLNAAAPGRVTTLRFGDLDLQGCDYHPSLADHRRLSILVEEAIGSALQPAR